MKDEFEVYGGAIKPIKSTGTHWIEHRIRAMQRLVDKYGLHCQHLLHKIRGTKKTTKDCIILQEKIDKLMLFCRCSFYCKKIQLNSSKG